MTKIISLFFIFFCFSTFSQVRGKITDAKNNPLSFVNIYLSESITGTTSNDDGEYILDVKKTGKHTIVFQFLGYKTLKKEVNITAFPFELNAQLQEENIVLDEISISTKDNPANAIIRKVIANKDKNTDKFADYTAKFYSRGLYKIKNAPKSILGQTLGDFGGGLDSTRSGIIYLSETISEIAYQKKPKNFKENVIASKVSGSDNGVSFNRAQDVNINFYQNNVEFGNDLISPISNSAFGYYRYKLEGTFYDKNGRLINKIKIIPKRKNDRVFSGAVYVVEDDWALYGVNVAVTGVQVNIPGIDVLKLKQDYNYSKNNDAWVLISQSITFKFSIFGFNVDGKFSSAYSEYNFEPNSNKITFTNEVLTFEKEATKKDSVYWTRLRPVPLTKEEVTDYSIKDSIKVVRKSKKYLDSINKKQNKFKVLSPLFGYTYRNSYEKWSLNFSGLINKFGFNTVQGPHASLKVDYLKRESDKDIKWKLGTELSYGFSEKKMRPSVFFSRKWNNFSKPELTISGGVKTAQFNHRIPVAPLGNLIRALLNKQSFIKIYEKTFAKIRYSEEVKNGIDFYTSLEYAKRKPLFNASTYSFAEQSTNNSYTSNNPLDPTNFLNAPFTEHSIATLNIGAAFTFGQKYLSYPDRKINIGNSKYPTLGLFYRKTFAADKNYWNSDVFIANLNQDINAGGYGYFKYNLRAGSFLKKKDIPIMDYLQANGNQLFFVTDNQLSSFNLLEYYKFFTNDKYAEGHIEHNFRGAILSKIPLINKLNFHLFGGAKTLFMADSKPYTEHYIGLSNVGIGKWRFLHIYFVQSNHDDVSDSGIVLRIDF